MHLHLNIFRLELKKKNKTYKISYNMNDINDAYTDFKMFN